MMCWRQLALGVAGWLAISVLCCPAIGLAQRDGGAGERDRAEADEPPETERSLSRRSMQPRSVPPQRAQPRQWYFGVRVRYVATGAEVTETIPRSPASRVGLEPRDLIVAVGGYQVGYVGWRLYPLERELDLRVDRHGSVLLLVQNHRNGELTNVQVRLEGNVRPPRPEPGPERPALLSGTVTSRTAGQLPRSAVLTVQLIDLSNRIGIQYPIAQKEFGDLGPLPIPFELRYDPERLSADREYGLRAFVTVYGVMSLQTRETYRFVPGEATRRIHMVLERAR